jgi:hypothetical protein
VIVTQLAPLLAVQEQPDPVVTPTLKLPPLEGKKPLVDERL